MIELGRSFSEHFDAFDIEYEKRSGNVNMPVYHFHDRHEIYYLMSGERNYFIDNRTYHIKKGDIVLIKSNVIHRTTAIENMGYARILFNIRKPFLDALGPNLQKANLLSCFDENATVLSLNKLQQEFVENTFYKMVEECRDKKEGYKAYVEILMCEFLLFLKRCIDSGAPHVIDYSNPKYEKISSIVTYINNNYMNDISLTQLSKMFYISVSNLTKTFKLATGFTFTQYLNSVRIKEAQHLLRKTNLSVAEISESVGYDNLTHFGRVFKQISGCSALKFRKKALS